MLKAKVDHLAGEMDFVKKNTLFRRTTTTNQTFWAKFSKRTDLLTRQGHDQTWVRLKIFIGWWKITSSNYVLVADSAQAEYCPFTCIALHWWTLKLQLGWVVAGNSQNRLSPHKLSKAWRNNLLDLSKQFSTFGHTLIIWSANAVWVVGQRRSSWRGHSL